ncbi:MAG: hypothetical protein A2X94_15960 [Bdellovibrionales bacterium GWB1_55_8]|nr:MAG: hypothetical protein A2X94_15960 [Bdellovibrionales bacterium GWB1_55_8]
MRRRLIEKHSRWIRWTHWLNFPLLSVMLWSGIWIYWANDVYRPFFPEWFYEFFRIDHKLAKGMAVHFFFMWPFLLNGLVHAVYLAVTGEWRHITPDRKAWRELPSTFTADLGWGTSPPIRGKFNAAQRVAYTCILLMGTISILSGLAIYKPVQLDIIRTAFGGYETARLIHFVLALGYAVFFIIHVIQVLRAGWNNLRSMLAGFEVKNNAKG